MAFLKSGYSVVAKSLRASQSLRSTPGLVVAGGDLQTLQPMGSIAEISDPVPYLSNARQVTGEVLHVDGGADGGRW
jgi:NAD(P)-dependent dehydrogenase (short-subunit alcohol dehydrogenase family)